jgi:hypothetical protein
VGEVSNQASVVSSTFDSNSGDNSGTETTTVQMSLDPIPSPTSDNTPTYSGIANPDGGTVTVTVKNSGSQVVQTRTANPDPQTGTYSVEGFPGLVDGDYTAQATQDTDSSQVRSFTIDTGGPPPVTETTVFPDSVAVVKGKQVAGDASSLEDDDDDFFSVKPRSDQTRVVWEGLFQSVPNDIDRLEITYKGKNSKGCSQSVSIFNDATGSFVVADQQTVGTSEQEISFDDTDLPGPPSDYVSGTGGSGTVRVRIKCQAGKVVSLGDLMKVTYEQSP